MTKIFNEVLDNVEIHEQYLPANIPSYVGFIQTHQVT